MGEYDRQIATAKRLIKKKGQGVTWRSIENGAPPDASKPWKTSTSTNLDNLVDIVFLPVSRENKRFIQALGGTEVSTGFLLGYMAAVDFEPSIKDVVIRNGEQLEVLNIDIVAPNGDPILYILEFGA